MITGIESEQPEVDSPILDQTTREKLINLGQSLDSKQFTDALGFIDLRLLLKCFAKAISKHVDFSRGYLFLEDMKKSATLKKDGLKFTYNLGKNMKIDMNRLKKKACKNKQDKIKQKGQKSTESSDSNKSPIGIEETKEYDHDFTKAHEVAEDEVKQATKVQNAMHAITINDSEFFDSTSKGQTLLTNTNQFEAQNKLGESSAHPVPETLKKGDSAMMGSMQSSNMFNLSNDSTIKMPDSLLSSFVTTMDNKNSTYKSGMSGGYNDSMTYSKTGLTFNKEGSRAIPMEVIESEDGDSGSQFSPTEAHEEREDFDEEEDIDRFEEVDVREVSIDSSCNTTKRTKQKALLTPDEIEQVHKERETINAKKEPDMSTSNRTQTEYAIQCKDFIESGKYNLEDFKQAMGKLFPQ